MSLADFWLHSDAFSQFLALVLLGLSVASWVVIAWKWRMLRRVQADVPRSIAAFWQAPHLSAAGNNCLFLIATASCCPWSRPRNSR